MTVSKIESSNETFKILVIILLGMILFVTTWSVRETKTNRTSGYSNRAVACAILKSQVTDGDTGSNDPFMNQVFSDSCLKGPISDRYNNVGNN